MVLDHSRGDKANAGKWDDTREWDGMKKATMIRINFWAP